MSYVPTTTPRPTSASPSAALKVLTIVGALIAVCLLVASVALQLGSHSHKQQAEQARNEAQSLRNQAKDVETQIATVRTQVTEASNKKQAQEWCDGFTSADPSLDTIHKNASTLASMPQTRRDVIAQICPQKKEFAEGYKKDYKKNLVTGDVDCSISGNTVSVTGRVQLSAPTLSALGSFDVNFDIYITRGEPTLADKPADRVTVTIPPGGQGTYSSNVPAPSFDEAICTVRPTGLWPSGV